MVATRNLETLLDVLNAGVMELRDVDGGEDPFLYASGNRGPGYVSIKSLVGQKGLIKPLIEIMARRVQSAIPNLDFVAGNVTGGMVPGWELSERLELFLTKRVPFVYIRDTQKKTGHRELITGLTNNPDIKPGDNALVVEELVNFSQTTCNSARILREAGYQVTHAACILFYDHPEAKNNLEDCGIQMVCAITLPDLLTVAEAHKTHPIRLINSYREFLTDPLAWQAKQGLLSAN